MLINKCPECDSIFRPYGDDLFSAESGGIYYKLCEKCNKAYAFSKLDDKLKFEGTLEGLLYFKSLRGSKGFV